MNDASRANEMKKYNVWEDPVLCFITTEYTAKDGSKFIYVQAFDEFDEEEGGGIHNIDGGGRIVSTFPAPVGAHSIYGQCDGCDGGMYCDATYLGCEIPHGRIIDWKKKIIETRKLCKVDVMTGKKVK